MTNYKSKITQINRPVTDVFLQFSDLSKLEKFKNQSQEFNNQNITFSQDKISINIAPLGDVFLKIVETELNSRIKFAFENIPVTAFMWINLKEKTENSTDLQITAEADIPFFLKHLIGGKIQEGIDIIAENITKLMF